jgi:exodeoxyribonuclease VII small subunit
MVISSIPTEELDYEAAFTELEEVVAALETGQTALQDALELFERGQALAKRCAGLLDQAELKVHTLSGQDFEPPEDQAEQA